MKKLVVSSMVFGAMTLLLVAAEPPKSTTKVPPDFTALFNGKDLSGWKIPEGDNGHWKVVEGVIDYDAQSESKKDKNLWTEKSYKDFVLMIDWRLKPEMGLKRSVPVILQDGSTKQVDGKDVTEEIDDVDSGIYLRGTGKSQVNIWNWSIGSGEVYGYRTDAKMSPEVRKGVTPKKKMDKPRGEWNTFQITMKGDRLTVSLNGEEVITNAQLPNIPAEGPIGLQHHGSFDPKSTGPKPRWTGAPSLVQFRNVYIKELK